VRPGGTILFDTWGPLSQNEVPEAIDDELRSLLPNDPPSFLRDLPHGYHDEGQIRADLEAAGLTGATIDRVEHRSHAANADLVARAFCRGTPLRHGIEQRMPGRLDEATGAVAKAIRSRFGSSTIDSTITALVVEVRAP
jgi:hypothetical protein